MYVESSFGNYKAYGGNGSGAQTYLEMAGGINIFEDSPLYFEADPEAVVTSNPDIIIKQLRNDVGYPANDFSVMSEARDEILNRPELADVKAVKEGRVYIMLELRRVQERDLLLPAADGKRGCRLRAKFRKASVYSDPVNGAANHAASHLKSTPCQTARTSIPQTPDVPGFQEPVHRR